MTIQASHPFRARITTLALAIAFAFTAMTASAQSEQSKKGLQGTWRVQVTLQNCDTHVPLGPPFSSLLSFARGGTVTGTTSNPGFQAGQRTSDFGVWKYNGHHTYSAASEAYILFTSAPNPPAPGFQRGRQRISQLISVDGDHFNSAATVDFFDVNGATVLSACAVASGQRFE